MAFEKIATLDEVPPGQVRVFRTDGRNLAIANVEGEIYAIDDVCTHDGGPLGEGTVIDNTVECPRHGARFDLRTGRPVVLPAVMPVRTYPVQVEGQDIKVDI